MDGRKEKATPYSNNTFRLKNGWKCDRMIQTLNIFLRGISSSFHMKGKGGGGKYKLLYASKFTSFVRTQNYITGPRFYFLCYSYIE